MNAADAAGAIRGATNFKVPDFGTGGAEGLANMRREALSSIADTDPFAKMFASISNKLDNVLGEMDVTWDIGTVPDAPTRKNIMAKVGEQLREDYLKGDFSNNALKRTDVAKELEALKRMMFAQENKAYGSLDNDVALDAAAVFEGIIGGPTIRNMDMGSGRGPSGDRWTNLTSSEKEARIDLISDQEAQCNLMRELMVDNEGHINELDFIDRTRSDAADGLPIFSDSSRVNGVKKSSYLMALAQLANVDPEVGRLEMVREVKRSAGGTPFYKEQPMSKETSTVNNLDGSDGAKAMTNSAAEIFTVYSTFTGSSKDKDFMKGFMDACKADAAHYQIPGVAGVPANALYSASMNSNRAMVNMLDSVLGANMGASSSWWRKIAGRDPGSQSFPVVQENFKKFRDKMQEGWDELPEDTKKEFAEQSAWDYLKCTSTMCTVLAGFTGITAYALVKAAVDEAEANERVDKCKARCTPTSLKAGILADAEEPSWTWESELTVGAGEYSSNPDILADLDIGNDEQCWAKYFNTWDGKKDNPSYTCIKYCDLCDDYDVTYGDAFTSGFSEPFRAAGAGVGFVGGVVGEGLAEGLEPILDVFTNLMGEYWYMFLILIGAAIMLTFFQPSNS
jgi:hypothetical protein